MFVLAKTETTALAVARTVRDTFPGAYLVAHADARSDGNRDGDTRTALASVTDKLIDPARAVATDICECVGEPTLPRLWETLRDIDRLAVVAHDSPDPDAIASGVALSRLAADVGCETEVCYYGEISHQENRAFVNALELELRNLDPGTEPSGYDGIALVDHAHPGVNDQLPAEASVDIVIDHHPPRETVGADFVDLRTGVGATSTLLFEYFDRYDREMDTAVATALLFGIHVDTDGFKRGASAQDLETAAQLVDVADLETLGRIESPSIDRGTFDVLARAISNRHVENDVVFSFVDSIETRDVLPQAADRLLSLNDVATTLVYGIVDETVHVSARSRAGGLDLGETVREAFGGLGTAGGHVDMAGAQLELDMFAEFAESDSVSTLVDSLVADLFLDALEHGPRPPQSTAGE
ncbi:MAG: exopolyphosphatase-related protein [halophilic archaeon J07HX64]|nr:MAG: exopolyphosphatase-related protein [halophilic archaeon J07HX64]